MIWKAVLLWKNCCMHLYIYISFARTRFFAAKGENILFCFTLTKAKKTNNSLASTAFYRQRAGVQFTLWKNDNDCNNCHLSISLKKLNAETWNLRTILTQRPEINCFSFQQFLKKPEKKFRDSPNSSYVLKHKTFLRYHTDLYLTSLVHKRC